MLFQDRHEFILQPFFKQQINFIMADPISNINLNMVNNVGNTGLIPNYAEPGIPVAYILAPLGVVIPPTEMINQSTFNTYLTARLLNNVRGGRWYALTQIDQFKDDTKAPSKEDTGIFNRVVFQYATLWSARYLQDFGNFQELLEFDECQNEYGLFVVDSSGNIGGTIDPAGTNGLMALSMNQFKVMNIKRRDNKTANIYMIDIQFTNATQFNQNYAAYVANINPANLVGLQNAVCQDISTIAHTPLGTTSATDIVITVKTGNGSEDWIEAYAQSLTAPCFAAYNLTTATTLTINSATFGNFIASGQLYWFAWLILSAAPTAGNLVQVSTASVSVVNGIIPGANIVTEIAQVGVDGANAAVHTF